MMIQNGINLQLHLFEINKYPIGRQRQLCDIKFGDRNEDNCIHDSFSSYGKKIRKLGEIKNDCRKILKSLRIMLMAFFGLFICTVIQVAG